jgi:excinuclease ABC subunit C
MSVAAGFAASEAGWPTGQTMRRFLVQVYDGESADAIPREVLLPRQPDDAAAVATWLSGKRGSRVALRVPQRGDKRSLMETVARNAGQALTLHKTRRASDLTTRSRALEEIQQALTLPEAPLRIECYDVSNLQGTEVVASMVVFEDGLPRKSDYRRFVIKGVDGQNDVAAMHETISRRFRRLLDDRAESAQPDLGVDAAVDGPTLIDPETGRPRKFAYTPGLVVVDGGPPQVAAAQRALDELGIDDVPVIGLAKRLEEVWRPSEPDPVILPRTSEGLYLLQRVRDEAHRFAITHHRNRRSKSMVESVLDDVPGLGEVRRKVLLRHFGSLRKLRAATPDEIAALPGFGARTAESIVLALAAESRAAQPAVNTATGEIMDAGPGAGPDAPGRSSDLVPSSPPRGRTGHG